MSSASDSSNSKSNSSSPTDPAKNSKLSFNYSPVDLLKITWHLHEKYGYLPGHEELSLLSRYQSHDTFKEFLEESPERSQWLEEAHAQANSDIENNFQLIQQAEEDRDRALEAESDARSLLEETASLKAALEAKTKAQEKELEEALRYRLNTAKAHLQGRALFWLLICFGLLVGGMVVSGFITPASIAKLVIGHLKEALLLLIGVVGGVYGTLFAFSQPKRNNVADTEGDPKRE